MNNKKVIIISLFYYEKTDNIRISTVYNLLKEKNAEVELITTDFNHRTKKKHRKEEHPADITFIPVPEYKKNISPGRLFSHLIFAIRLRKYLKKQKNHPTAVYCVVPAVTAGIAAAGYCKKNQIPLAIDVIDLWPESFIVISRYKKILSLLTYPWKLLAIKSYRSADQLYAGSADYARYTQQFNKKTKAIPVYLGTGVREFKKQISQSKLILNKTKNEIWICFGGMLGNSYEFEIILKGFKLLSEDRKNIKLIFIGGGQKSDKILKFRDQHKLNIEVTGFQKYSDYLNYLAHSDIAVNSFKEGSRVAYSYKFNDYLSAGLPVLNNVSGEMEELVSRYNIGRNFGHSEMSFKNTVEELLDTPGLLDEMKKNSNFVATSVLNKETVYKEMLNNLLR